MKSEASEANALTSVLTQPSSSPLDKKQAVVANKMARTTASSKQTVASEASKTKALISDLTQPSSTCLAKERMLEVKEMAKTSPSTIPIIWQLLSQRLRVRHSHVRLLALLICHELLLRSRTFRDLLLADLSMVLDLTIAPGTIAAAASRPSALATLRNPHRRKGSRESYSEGLGEPLPPPEAAARALRQQAVQFLKEWTTKFGGHYQPLMLAYQWLSQAHGLTLEDPVDLARDTEMKKKLALETQAAEVATKLKEVKGSLASAVAATTVALTELEQCFDILVPNILTTAPVSNADPEVEYSNHDDGEEWERVIADEAPPLCTPASPESTYMLRLPPTYQLEVAIPATIDVLKDDGTSITTVAQIKCLSQKVAGSLRPALQNAMSQLQGMLDPHSSHPDISALSATAATLEQRWATCRRKYAELGLGDPDAIIPSMSRDGEEVHPMSSQSVLDLGTSPVQRSGSLAMPSIAVTSVQPRPLLVGKRPHTLKDGAANEPPKVRARKQEKDIAWRRTAVSHLQDILHTSSPTCHSNQVQPLANALEAELFAHQQDPKSYRAQLRRILFNLPHLAAQLCEGTVTVNEVVQAGPRELASKEVQERRRQAQWRAMQEAAAVCMARSDGVTCRHCGGEYVETVVIQQGKGKGHPVSLSRCGACNLAQ